MERPPKRQKLQIDVMLSTEDEESDSRGRIGIEEGNVQIAEDSDLMDNNNYLAEQEETAELDDMEVEQIERAENEEDADEDEDEEEFDPCDWCKGTVRSDEDRQLLMIWDEDVCRQCVTESDLEMNSAGEYDYPEGQFDDSETASDDGAGSDSEDEA